MKQMLDTHILSLALSTSSEGDPVRFREERQACEQLVRSLEGIRMSAIAWVEFLRAINRATGQPFSEALGELATLVRVEAVDPRVSVRAAELLNKHRQREDVCRRCLNVDVVAPCPQCGSVASHQQRLNDAIIVATADVLEDVEVLYSFDGGVLELGTQVTGCEVRRPPNPHGPLWEEDEG